MERREREEEQKREDVARTYLEGEPPSYRPAYASRLGKVSWAPWSATFRYYAQQGSSYFCASEFMVQFPPTNRVPSGRETNPARKAAASSVAHSVAKHLLGFGAVLILCARHISPRSFETIADTSRPLSSGRGMSLSCALVYGDDQRGADETMPSGAPAERTRRVLLDRVGSWVRRLLRLRFRRFVLWASEWFLP